jgi:hypothetical protein
MCREENDTLSQGKSVSQMLLSMSGHKALHLSFHLRKPKEFHDTAPDVPIGTPHDTPRLWYSHAKSPDTAGFRPVHALFVQNPQQCSQHLTDPERGAVRQVVHQLPHNTKHLPNRLLIHP